MSQIILQIQGHLIFEMTNTSFTCFSYVLFLHVSRLWVMMMSSMTRRQFQRYCQEQRAAEEDEQRQNAYDKVIHYLEREPRGQKAALELTLALWGQSELP